MDRIKEKIDEFELFYITHFMGDVITLGRYPMTRDGLFEAIEDMYHFDNDDGALYIERPDGESQKIRSDVIDYLAEWLGIEI